MSYNGVMSQQGWTWEPVDADDKPVGQPFPVEVEFDGETLNVSASDPDGTYTCHSFILRDPEGKAWHRWVPQVRVEPGDELFLPLSLTA